MSYITLIMTRVPLEEVDFGKKNGRWGRMVVVKGGKVLNTRNVHPGTLPDLFSIGQEPPSPGSPFTGCTATVSHHGLYATAFRVGQKGICVDTFGAGVEVIGRFDTLERFRTDSNKSKFYVQLKPRPERPYEIRMDISQNVKELNSTGRCFRVHGHDTKNGSGGRAGILIHEAPHPGWLIGCIGPRPHNYRTVNHDKAASRSAMEAIFGLMGGFAKGKKAELVTMDW